MAAGACSRIEFENVLVEFNSLCFLAGLLAAHRLQKQGASAAGNLGRTQAVVLGFHQIAMALEVEDELPGDGIHDRARMAEEHPRAVPGRARLEQRIDHAGDGLHGMNAGADAGRGKPHGAQVAQLAQLDEVLKAVCVGKGDERCSLPRSQLLGANVKYAKNILTAISGHSARARKSTVTHLKAIIRGLSRVHKGRNMKFQWINRYQS